MEALGPVIQTLLTLVTGFLPLLTGANASTAVDKIIAELQNIIPTLASIATPLLAEVQTLISSLQNGSTPLTSAQMDALDAMSAQCDAAFEADANADGFPTPTATAPPATPTT